MIRSFWIVLSTLALANLLAMIGFVGWLGASGRLDRDRVQRVRELFSETITAEEARTTAEAAQTKADALAAAAAEEAKRPPISSSDRLALQAQYDAVMQQRLERTRETLNAMRGTLSDERAKLDKDLAAFHAERDKFKAMRDRIKAIDGDAQFGKALALYSSLKPTTAANALRTLLDQGKDEQVVAYLNAMDARKASKILAQFKPALAAGLLERLRTRGIAVAGSEEP